jgi:VIT1/CCC1 family predicted Fe2+/Mn2+ transporter
MTTAAQADRAEIQIWMHHLRDEADAAYLYRILAVAEPDIRRRATFERLAGVEDRHVELWRSILETHGHVPPALRPSARARILAALARWFGPGFLLPALHREEGREVRAYLALHRSSERSATREAALRLARESAEHAGTLGELAGSDGEPWHSTASGGFLRNVVYGFNDGLTANFGLVAGVVGASVDAHIILLSGVAGMIADALSMGSSGYLAAKSEREVYAHEIAMEREELRMMPEVEEEELALLYEAKGIETERARHMAHDVMRDPERALAEKVREELRIGEAHATPLKEGWVTGTATAVGALIPVAPFFFLPGSAAIWAAFAVAMLSHFAVGAARSLFTGRGIFRSGLDMFLVGLGVAVVGYVVGDAVAGWLVGR